MIEVGSYRPLLSRVLVVDCEEDLQVRRASQRPEMTPETVQAIMAAQTDRKTRLRVADDVIDNNGDLQSLETVVKKLDHQYRFMAGEQLRSLNVS
ncbi:MAG: dephospho-CoA kinase [Ferrovum sp.]|nr:dephospho-CoA kinase [Ferrovum sp.]